MARGLVIFAFAWLGVLVVGGAAMGYAAYEVGREVAGRTAADAVLPAGAPEERLDLRKGELCRVAATPPARVPYRFVVQFEQQDGAIPADEVAVAALRDGLPGLVITTGAVGPGDARVQVIVSSSDLWFEDRDVAGLACGMTILVEDQAVPSSTLLHEFGHVLGLPHEDGTWMEEGRRASQEDVWAGWNTRQTLHLAQYTVPGTPWPASLAEPK